MVKCECGKEYKKITKKHLNSNLHNELITIKHSVKQNIQESKSNNLETKELTLDKAKQDKTISQYNTRDYLKNSDLQMNKLDNSGNYILNKNKRIKFRRLPTRLIVVFYSRDSKNSYTISDYNVNQNIIIDEGIYTLKDVAYFNEGIPVYYIILTFNGSIKLEFSQYNDTLVEKDKTPQDIVNYLESQAIQELYRQKLKLRYSWLGYSGLLCVITGLIVAIVMYGVLKGYTI